MKPELRLANHQFDIELIFAAQSLAEFAAIAGCNAQRNPFVRGTPEWYQFDESYRTQLARQAVAAGKLADCQDELDAADPQTPGWLDRVMGFVLWTCKRRAA